MFWPTADVGQSFASGDANVFARGSFATSLSGPRLLVRHYVTDELVERWSVAHSSRLKIRSAALARSFGLRAATFQTARIASREADVPDVCKGPTPAIVPAAFDPNNQDADENLASATVLKALTSLGFRTPYQNRKVHSGGEREVARA